MQVGIVMHARASGPFTPSCQTFNTAFINYPAGIERVFDFNFGTPNPLRMAAADGTRDNTTIATDFKNWLDNNWIGDQGLLTTWGS